MCSGRNTWHKEKHGGPTVSSLKQGCNRKHVTDDPNFLPFGSNSEING